MFNILHPIPERQMVAFKWHFSLSRTKTLQTTTTQPPQPSPPRRLCQILVNALNNISIVAQCLQSVYNV